MPKLSATRSYADNQSPVQSDFDAFIDDIEILVNTIKLDDDNFQDGGITASDKLVDESIQANQIRNNNITTAKIADSAVTTAKIQDDAVTTAKIADGVVDEDVTSILAGYMPPGAVEMFHTFNSTVSVPRGWMVLNGDVVNQTNYDALHGAGAYTADGVSSSLLLNKNLPDMADKYPVGVSDTTKDGSSAIAAVGNTGNQINLQHSHETEHSHTMPNALEFNYNDTSPDTTTFNNLSAASSTTTYTTESTTSDNSLSTTQGIQPESNEVLFIMKVV